MGELLLTLKSDLCSSSGQNFSNVVDMDICTDEYGFPYIPARRIKGCLREAAEYIRIEDSTINKLFGKTGGNESGLVKIYSGRLSHYTALKQTLDDRKAWTRSRITDLFTTVKAQTAIEGAAAKKGSLRFIRTITHFLPYDTAEETAFEFAVKGVPDIYAHEFGRICKALRHIGLNRTRGLGAVKAVYKHTSDCGGGNAGIEPFKRGEEWVLPLHIEITEPVLIATADSSECMEYVPGTALLGAFARLAVLDGIKDENFDELFLSGKVSFGNLHVSGACGKWTIPAPHFMRKLKSTEKERDGRIVTVFDDTVINTDTDTPKILKGKTAYAADLTSIINTRTETRYHHSRGDDATLYTQTSLMPGQYLRGEITSNDERSLKTLASLLKKGDLRLGRSRSAQYSGCRVLPYEAVSENAHAHPLNVNSTVFVLESDVVLFDDNGLNTIDPQVLACKMGIPKDAKVKFDLAFKLVHGYNSKRNLRNIPVQAFQMGSTVTVEDYVPDKHRFTVGMRLSEGFGRIRVYGAGISTEIPGRNRNTGAKYAATDSDIAKKFEDCLDKEALRFAAIGSAEELFGRNADWFAKDGLNAAFVGVVSRMVETALDADEALRRINDIKDTEKRRKIFELLNKVCNIAVNGMPIPDEIKIECMLTVLRLARYKLKLDNKTEGGEAK